MADRAAIILAAGKSTRMNSSTPKVLHEVCGLPMLWFVLNACRLAGADRLLVVVGHGADSVRSRFSDEGDITWVEQAEQKGTGHAVMCCREALGELDGYVLVVAGDMPLVRREPLALLLESCERDQAALSLATAFLDVPTGYGRIQRDAEGMIEAIVEERDCSASQKEIQEVNPSFYGFRSSSLLSCVDELAESASSGEYYLTDMVELLRKRGEAVVANVTVSAEEALGVNSRLDLAMANRVMQDRIQLGLMADGVTIVDPDNTWIEADTSVGKDTVIQPFSFISAGALVGQRCRVGPFARISRNERIAAGTDVLPQASGANA